MFLLDCCTVENAKVDAMMQYPNPSHGLISE